MPARDRFTVQVNVIQHFENSNILVTTSVVHGFFAHSLPVLVVAAIVLDAVVGATKEGNSGLNYG